ncbi:hypothetical protein NHF46_04610 [Arthrobacter alpinus]|nr:hypothetical protein [Arthrobacter alpinus]
MALSTGLEQCGVASGALLASPNGTPVTANVWAEGNAGTASSVGDRSQSSIQVKPYGVPRAVPVNGSTAPRGDKTVRWTWSAPNMLGSTFKEYQYSLNSGAGLPRREPASRLEPATSTTPPSSGSGPAAWKAHAVPKALPTRRPARRTCGPLLERITAPARIPATGLHTTPRT